MDPITPQNDDAARREEETKAIQAAKAATGITYPLLVVTTTHPTDPAKDGPRVAFRRPNAGEWHRYRSESLTNDPQVKANAFQSIVIPCCIYPERATFLAMVQERPGIVELCGSELVEFAGAERAKKVERL
jgi:hypothetical protein